MAAGTAAIAIALWIQELLVAMDVAYAVLAGSIFVPIVLGMFWKKATPKAAFYAITSSAIVVLATLAIEGFSSNHPILYGIATNIVVMTAVSWNDSSRSKISA